MIAKPATDHDILQAHLRSRVLAHTGEPHPAAGAWLRHAAAVGAVLPLYLGQDVGLLLCQPGGAARLARPGHLPADLDTGAYLAFLQRLAAHPLVRAVCRWGVSEAVTGLLLARLAQGLSFAEIYRLPAGPAGHRLAARLRRQREQANPAEVWQTLPAGERPRLPTPAELARIEQNLARLKLDEVGYLHRYGAPPAGQPDARELLDLFTLLDLPAAVRLALSEMLRQVPRLSQSSPGGSVQSYPMGGYAGLTQRGSSDSLDSLVPTELAYPPRMFYERLLNRQALFYGREGTEEHLPALAYLITQAGLELRGDSQVLARALTLALSQVLARRGYRLAHSFVGSVFTPPAALDGGGSVTRLLLYRDEGRQQPGAMLAAVLAAARAAAEQYREVQLLWVLDGQWDADRWEDHLELYRALAQAGEHRAWFIRAAAPAALFGPPPGPALAELPLFRRQQVVAAELLWAERQPPPAWPEPPPAISPPRPWQGWAAELDRLGFVGQARDVFHFAAAGRQLELWQQLAALADQPDQAAIDAYLAGLAPAGLVYIPAGPFMMGSAPEKVTEMLAQGKQNHANLYRTQQPQHQVRLGGYYLGRYPVTNEEYAAFIEAGGYQAEQYWTETGWRWKGTQSQPRYWDNANFNQPQQPVVGVNWYEAVAYCRWRGGRLPTEAEWEKAAGWDPARGQPREYPWGDAWDERRCNINKRAGERTTPVGQYSPAGDSYYGCGDMAGNVYEWCSTRWGTNANEPEYRYPYQADEREDLSGGNEMWRVVRGSSWYVNTDVEYWARCAFRYWDTPNGLGDDNRGYRLCAPRRPPLLNSES